MRGALALLLAAVLALPVAADTPEKAAAVIGAMREAGCEMSLEAADDAAGALGIEIAELDTIIDLLYAGGLLYIDADEHMTMATVLCAAPPEDDAALFARLQREIDLEILEEAVRDEGLGLAGYPTPERAALVITTLRAHDCALTQAEAEEVLAVAGITPAEAYAVMAVLFHAGLMDQGAEPGELRLTDDICLADPADDAALYETALARLSAGAELADPDAVIAQRFGPDGIRAVLEFMAGADDCVLDTSDPAQTVEQVVEFLAFNVTGIHNLPPDFSAEAEADLRARIAQMLRDPGPGFAVEPGRLVLIDCAP